MNLFHVGRINVLASRSRAALWLLAATAMVHHPVLWIDHLLWNEIAFDKMVREGDLSGKLASLADQGIATAYNFLVLFAAFPDATRALRVAAFLSIWIIAWVLHAVLVRFARLPAGQALGAALVMVAYPAYQMYANAGTTIYVICSAVFALAVWCYLLGANRGPGRHRFWLVAAAGLWVISFTEQWLMVYFYGFLVAVFVSRPLAWWRRRWAATGDRWSLLRIHAVLLLMPPLYYYSQRKMFPLHPYYRRYSVPDFDWQKNLTDAWQAVSCSLLSPLARVLHAPAWFWWAAVATVGLFLGYRWLRQSADGTSSSDESGGVSALRLIIAGVLLLAAGLFPFVIVGKPFAADGTETRFSILVAPSLAVIAAGVIAAAARIRWVALRRGLGLAGGALLAAFALQHAQVYADWQACAIKDHAIVAALRGHVPPLGVNFFVVEGARLEHTYVRRHYDWGRILHDAWGGDDRIAEVGDRCGPAPYHYYTPLGISREKVADFRRWLGYGNPGPPDDWCEIKIETRPDFDFHEAGVWKVVGEDALRRLHLRTQTREDWLVGFIPRVSISAPHGYAFSSVSLPAQKFSWSKGAFWRRVSTQPLPVADPVIMEIKAHSDISGAFSLAPLGPGSFALRCDALPAAGGPAVLHLQIAPHVAASAADGTARAYGVVCDFHVFEETEPPRLIWITAGSKATEGAGLRPGVDSIEAWVTTPPVRAWLIWTARAPGDMVQIRELRTGFTMAHAD